MASIGVDLGGTKILAVLVESGEVRDEHKAPTPTEGGPQAILDAISVAAHAVDPDGVAVGVGVGVPGPVAPNSGVLPLACNLFGWTSPVDVASELSARLNQRPVFVDNDCNVATLAEHRLGAGRGVDDLVGVFLGTGVGAGLVLDGQLRRGPHGLAGEIGHTFVDFLAETNEAITSEAISNVGCSGELEDYAGRSALERRVRFLDERGESSLLVSLAGDGPIKSKLWRLALDEGDQLAVRLIDTAAEALAAALASVVNLLDVEIIILGGGMAERLGPAFRGDVADRLASRTFAARVVPVLSAEKGDSSGALGASLLVGDGPM